MFYLDFVQVEKGGVGTTLYSVELAKAVSLSSQRSRRYQVSHVTDMGLCGVGSPRPRRWWWRQTLSLRLLGSLPVPGTYSPNH